MKFSFDCENITEVEKVNTINLHITNHRQKILYSRLHVNLLSLENGYLSDVLWEKDDYSFSSTQTDVCSICIGPDGFMLKNANFALTIEELTEKEVASIKSLIKDLSGYFKSMRVNYMDVTYHENGKSKEVKMNRAPELTYFYGDDGSISPKFKFNNLNLKKWPVDDSYIPDLKKLAKMRFEPSSEVDKSDSESESESEKPFCRFSMKYLPKKNRAHITVPTENGYYDVKLGGQNAQMVKTSLDSLIRHFKERDEFLKERRY
jgi:hypothetical protein